jgi:hypothetical protein
MACSSPRRQYRQGIDLSSQPWAARMLLGAARKRVNHHVPANMCRPLGFSFGSAAFTLRNSQPAHNAVCEPSVPHATLSRMQRALARVKPKMISYFEKPSYFNAFSLRLWKNNFLFPKLQENIGVFNLNLANFSRIISKLKLNPTLYSNFVNRHCAFSLPN